MANKFVDGGVCVCVQKKTDISLTKVASGLGNATPSIRPSELTERKRENNNNTVIMADTCSGQKSVISKILADGSNKICTGFLAICTGDPPSREEEIDTKIHIVTFFAFTDVL